MYAIHSYDATTDHWTHVVSIPKAFSIWGVIELTRYYGPADNMCIEDSETGEICWEYAEDGYGDEPRGDS